MLGVGGKEMKRRRDSLHGKTASPKDSAPFDHVAARRRICAERDKTRLKWVIVFSQIITANVGGAHHTSSLASTAKQPHGNFKLVSVYIFTNRSPLKAQYWSNLKHLQIQLGLQISF